MAIINQTIDLVENDLLENLFFELEGQDISSYTSINLRVRRPDGTTLNKTAVIDDGPAGKFHFTWAAGDLIKGVSRARVQFEITPGVFLSVPAKEPLQLNVSAKV